MTRQNFICASGFSRFSIEKWQLLADFWTKFRLQTPFAPTVPDLLIAFVVLCLASIALLFQTAFLLDDGTSQATACAALRGLVVGLASSTQATQRVAYPFLTSTLQSASDPLLDGNKRG
jgi:hypothetical protein